MGVKRRMGGEKVKMGKKEECCDSWKMGMDESIVK
jgi:hypothetical protein